MQFYQLAKGARFEFLGKQFEKVAMSMAVDAERCGNVFWGGTENRRTALVACGRGRKVEATRYALDFHYNTSAGSILKKPGNVRPDV
jgi:hypothetical protein